jgi:hypothetical protein
MRLRRIAVIVLLGIVLVSTVACGSNTEQEPTPTLNLVSTPTSTFTKPHVSYVPSEWSLYYDEYYDDKGLIEYKTANGDFVMIWYEAVPYGLNASDGNALISIATSGAISPPYSTGTTYVNGHLAGYVLKSVPEGYWRDEEIDFVNGDTFIEINIYCDPSNLTEVNELINSIW